MRSGSPRDASENVEYQASERQTKEASTAESKPLSRMTQDPSNNKLVHLLLFPLTAQSPHNRQDEGLRARSRCRPAVGGGGTCSGCHVEQEDGRQCTFLNLKNSRSCPLGQEAPRPETDRLTDTMDWIPGLPLWRRWLHRAMHQLLRRHRHRLQGQLQASPGPAVQESGLCRARPRRHLPPL